MSSTRSNPKLDVAMVERIKQKYESLSHSVLVEVASVQEEAMLNLKKTAEEHMLACKQLKSKNEQAKLGQKQVVDLVRHIESTMADRMKNIVLKMEILADKVTAVEQVVQTVGSELSAHDRAQENASTALKSTIDDLRKELYNKSQTESVGIQCERPRTSLLWEEGNNTSGLPSLIQGEKNLLSALEHPVIKHLFDCWVAATATSNGPSELTEDLVANELGNLNGANTDTSQQSLDDPSKAEEASEGFSSYFSLGRRSPKPPKPPSSTRSVRSHATQNDIEAFILGRNTAHNFEVGEMESQNIVHLRTLIHFIRKVLDVKREGEFYHATHTIELNQLPKEIFEGFCFHLYPVLCQREGLDVKLYKRVREVHDLKISVTHLSARSRVTTNQHTKENSEIIVNESAAGTSEGMTTTESSTTESHTVPQSTRTTSRNCIRCRQHANDFQLASSDAAAAEVAAEENPWGALNRVLVYQYCTPCVVEMEKQDALQRAGRRTKVKVNTIPQNNTSPMNTADVSQQTSEMVSESISIASSDLRTTGDSVSFQAIPGKQAKYVGSSKEQLDATIDQTDSTIDQTDSNIDQTDSNIDQADSNIDQTESNPDQTNSTTKLRDSELNESLTNEDEVVLESLEHISRATSTIGGRRQEMRRAQGLPNSQSSETSSGETLIDTYADNKQRPASTTAVLSKTQDQVVQPVVPKTTTHAATSRVVKRHKNKVRRAVID